MQPPNVIKPAAILFPTPRMCVVAMEWKVGEKQLTLVDIKGANVELFASRGII